MLKKSEFIKEMPVCDEYLCINGHIAPLIEQIFF